MGVNPTSSETDPLIADGRAGLTIDVSPSGGGYRAVIKRDGQVIWACPHVHFTEHSVRSCPAASQHLAALA